MSPLSINQTTFADLGDDEGEFDAGLAKINNFDDLAKLYREYDSDDPITNPEGDRIFDKAFGLITTTKQALTLGARTDTGSAKKKRCLDKALELAQTEGNLDEILNSLQDYPICFEYRNLLRKVFDKADALGMPNLY